MEMERDGRGENPGSLVRTDPEGKKTGSAGKTEKTEEENAGAEETETNDQPSNRQSYQNHYHFYSKQIAVEYPLLMSLLSQ